MVTSDHFCNNCGLRFGNEESLKMHDCEEIMAEPPEDSGSEYEILSDDELFSDNDEIENSISHEEKLISDSETTASSQDNFMPYIVNIEGNGSFDDDFENNDENEDIEAYDTIEDPFDFYSKPETNVAIGSIFLQN